MERLYPLQHRHVLKAGKPWAAIISSAISHGQNNWEKQSRILFISNK
jgi:hypothetical protein